MSFAAGLLLGLVYGAVRSRLERTARELPPARAMDGHRPTTQLADEARRHKSPAALITTSRG